MDTYTEAKRLSIYLCGKPCSRELAYRYQIALMSQQILLSPKDEKLWRLALKNRFYLSTIDSGLALTYPKSQIRRKIFLMMAILEASTEFCDEFIPKEKNKFLVFLNLLSIGVKSVFFALVGILIIRMV